MRNMNIFPFFPSFFSVSDTYDYAVPDICNAPLIITQPKLPAVSPPLITEIDTLISSGSSTRNSKSSRYTESPAKKVR